MSLQARFLRHYAALTRIQRWWRSVWGKIQAHLRWLRLQPSEEKLNDYVSTIQIAWRLHRLEGRTRMPVLPQLVRMGKFKQAVGAYRDTKREILMNALHCAVKVQAVWRGTCARRFCQALRSHREVLKKSHDAAVCIQAKWRMYVVLSAYNELKVLSLAATRIQACIRGYLARKEVRGLLDALCLPPEEAVSTLLGQAERLHRKWTKYHEELVSTEQRMQVYTDRISRHKTLVLRTAKACEDAKSRMDREQQVSSALPLGCS